MLGNGVITCSRQEVLRVLRSDTTMARCVYPQQLPHQHTDHKPLHTNQPSTSSPLPSRVSQLSAHILPRGLPARS